MTEEIKKKQQQEWLQTVTLTPEQVQSIIIAKAARGKVYSAAVRQKKTQTAVAVCDKCQTEIF